MNEDIKRLEDKIDDLFQKLTEKQNSQYTDIILELKEIKDRMLTQTELSASLEDEKYEEAKQLVIEHGTASTSFLQEKLGIGYARAARLMDMFEENEVIEIGSGAKPRKVISNQSNNQ